MPQGMASALFATLVLFASAYAQAQYINPFTGINWNNPVSSSIDTMIFNDIQQRTLMLPYERGEPSPAPPADATSFAPTSSFAAARSMAASLSDDAEVQHALLALFEQGRDEFEAQARADGKPNNVALAISFFIQANYYVYAGGTEVSEAAQASLWAAIHETLVSSPGFASASNLERQELYETFVVLAVLPLYGYLLTLQDGDIESAALFQALAGQNLEAAFEVSPDALRFMVTGLEIGP